MRRLLLGVFLTLAALVAGMALWLLADHARGQAQWQTRKAQRIQMGDRFTWEELVPPAIPDSENFTLAPVVANAVLGTDPNALTQAIKLPKLGREAGDWRLGERTDLQACAQAFGTPSLDAVLRGWDPVLTDLARASQRPASRLPVDLASFEAPGLKGFRDAGRALRLRALVNLARARSDQALGDVQTLLRIAGHLEREPSLLAHLLRLALVNMALQPIWEGLQDQRFTPTQLEALQADLQRIDLLASGRLAFEGERMGMVTSMTCLAEGRMPPRGLQPREGMDPRKRLGRLGRGWAYRNLLEWDRFFAATFLDSLDPKGHRIHPGSAPDLATWMHARRFRWDLSIARIALPALVGQIERTAHTQSAVDQAQVACALERHRAAVGALPQSLEALSPRFITRVPHDLAGGQPLRYAVRTGTFSLHSIGWNLKDDGGLRRLKPEGSLAWGEGDWVWASGHPEPPPPAR